jgi:hypothetical protein
MPQASLGILTVDRNYDIFEILSDGSLVWRAALHGRDDAIRKLHEIGKDTKNEVRVMHVPTNTIIATTNTPK